MSTNDHEEEIPMDDFEEMLTEMTEEEYAAYEALRRQGVRPSEAAYRVREEMA